MTGTVPTGSSAPLLLCSSAPLLLCSPALLHMLTRKRLGSPHPPSHACRPAAHLVMERSGLTDVVLMPLDVTTSLVCTERLTEQVVGRKLMRDSGGGGSGDDAERPWTRPYDASSRGCKLFYRDLSDFMCETNMAFKETGGACGFLVHSPPPPTACSDRLAAWAVARDESTYTRQVASMPLLSCGLDQPSLFSLFSHSSL
jgi:hypothetical protein